MLKVEEFFEAAYSAVERYWWRQPHAYSTSPDDHAASLITQGVLRLAHRRGPGRALDLGSGEGADAIRLALMGWDVTAVELTTAGTGKIREFARAAAVNIRVVHADATTFHTPDVFDLVICNGVLHYVEDKTHLCQAMQSMTARGGINAISLWSSYTPVPYCHRVVPTYPDDERGEVVAAYASWHRELLYFERAKLDTGHVDMPPHSHSYIKLIAVDLNAGRSAGGAGEERNTAEPWIHAANTMHLPGGGPSYPDRVRGGNPVRERAPRCATS